MKTIDKALLLSFSVFSATSCVKQQVPNIILVYADDLGYGDLGSYGQKIIKTPNLDRMAAEGIMLTQFYTGCPVSAPSRCSLMTGKHSGHAYIRHNANEMPHGQVPIPADEFTIAEMLKEKGYSTGCYGKWSLGAPGNSGDPLTQGFDQFFGYYCQCMAHNYFPEMLWRNKDTVKLRNETIPVNVSFIGYPLSYSTKKIDYSANIIFDEAVKFVETNKSNPFFLYYATTLPHNNGEAPEDEIYEIPDWGIYADSAWTPAEKGYAAMVSLLDHQVGILMEKLKSLGIAENTIVIFTSDNGADGFIKRFQSDGLSKGRKTDLYEGGIREPMIAWWPGKIKGNTTNSMPCVMYDLMPTFAELAGAEKPATTDGRSILPTLLNNKQKQSDFLMWEIYENDRSPKQAVRVDDWKLIRYYFTNPEKQQIELYNIKEDESETHNVASENSGLVNEMITIMDREHTKYLNEGRVK